MISIPLVALIMNLGDTTTGFPVITTMAHYLGAMTVLDTLKIPVVTVEVGQEAGEITGAKRGCTTTDHLANVRETMSIDDREAVAMTMYHQHHTGVMSRECIMTGWNRLDIHHVLFEVVIVMEEALASILRILVTEGFRLGGTAPDT